MRKGKLPDGRWAPLYLAWRNAKGRCRNVNSPDYPYYGGRGVTFWPGWDSYEVFAAAVGPHPGTGWTLDREDNSKGYEPGNVRWATRKTQAHNRPGYVVGQKVADQIRSEYLPGVRQVDLAAKYGISQVTVSKIVREATGSTSS